MPISLYWPLDSSSNLEFADVLNPNELTVIVAGRDTGSDTTADIVSVDVPTFSGNDESLICMLATADELPALAPSSATLHALFADIGNQTLSGSP